MLASNGQTKTSLPLYSPYYAVLVCNGVCGAQLSVVAVVASGQHSYLRRCWSGGEPLAMLFSFLQPK